MGSDFYLNPPEDLDAEENRNKDKALRQLQKENEQLKQIIELDAKMLGHLKAQLGGIKQQMEKVKMFMREHKVAAYRMKGFVYGSITQMLGAELQLMIENFEEETGIVLEDPDGI